MKTNTPRPAARLPFLNTLSRRDFLGHTLRAGAAFGLASLTQVPPFAARALAEGNIGTNGKKLLFIFLRGANDALNSCLPVKEPSYTQSIRPNIWIPQEATNYYDALGPCDFPTGLGSTFAYGNAIRVGDGFNALHPSLKFLAPVYNAGDLLLIQRVGYPRQSRSHFDSQAYWESGEPNTISREGIFYRTLLESGVAATNPLAGVSIQSSLPTIFQGSDLAITNLSDPTRYDLMGTPTPAGDQKLMNAIARGNQAGFAAKRSRGLLRLSYENLVNTLDLFAGLPFDESENTFIDDVPTDGGADHYHLFPTSLAINGAGTASTYVVDAGGLSFFQQLKGAALVLNHTDAVIAGTELGNFDTHDNQGGATGNHANLLSRVAWAIYALRKYFLNYSNKARWEDVVIVTLSEFGRTTVQNSNNGTDHAEAGLMLVAGGSVKGKGKAQRTSGVIGGHPNDSVPWVPGAAGSMFGISGRYLRRAVDFRSVLGEVIRDHLGATQAQLNRIIPGYANPVESLLSKGTSAIDQTEIMGEVGVI
jgi:uncharacterized protein (DUF1501 family)